MRYLAPITPVLAIAAGLALNTAWRWARARLGAMAGVALVSVLLAGMGLWAAAFEAIYAGKHPRLTASEWIYANVPAGSALGGEYWDDALPIGLMVGLTPQDRQYEIVPFDFYADHPPTEVADAIYQHLERVDYLILSSNRVEGSVRRSPWRYPVQIRYYNLLRSGQLGFSLIAEFHSYPRIGPLHIPDQWADESFINYDHPRVLIFKKDE